MRRIRFLPGNKRSTSPTRAIWVDTETVPTEEAPGLMRHDLTFGWGCYSRRHRVTHWSEPEWSRFETASEFWEWALSHVPERTALYLYAHNAAYDMTVLRCWDLLPELGWELKSAVLDSPPFLATWRNGRRVLRMVDTLNLWRKPLKVLGEVVGLSKYEMPDGWTDREAGDRYCKRDVEIIRAMCLRWWGWLKSEDLGSAANTLAAQALTTYRHRFLTHPIFLDGNKAALSLSRDGYSGGRVECFRVGKLERTSYLLDVNSMYPAVMESEQYPTKLVLHCRRIDLAELTRWLTRYCVMARVEIDTPEPCYPCRVPGYLLHPVGRFQTVLATPELIHALQHGRIVRVLDAAIYQRAPIFKSWVGDMYRRRQEYQAAGDTFGAWVTKLMLNSLYGKFGQRGWKTEIRADVPWNGVGAWTEIDADTGRVYRMRALAGVLVVEYQEGEATFSHPAIAAHVTAWGRMRLWDLIQTAGAPNVDYCDTDSVWTNEEGLRRLWGRIDPHRLGALKLEAIDSDVEIHGPKDYRRGTLIRTKGVRSKAVWLTPDSVEQDMWIGLKGLIQRGTLDAPRVRTQVKVLSRVYRKGVILDSGRTRPWNLPGEWGAWGTR